MFFVRDPIIVNWQWMCPAGRVGLETLEGPFEAEASKISEVPPKCQGTLDLGQFDIGQWGQKKKSLRDLFRPTPPPHPPHPPSRLPRWANTIHAKVVPRRVGWGPTGGEANNFALFSLSPANFLSFFSLLGRFFVLFWCVFVGRDPEMCTFGVVGLSCETPATEGWEGPKPPGLHTTAREPKRAHFRVPAFRNTIKTAERAKEKRNYGRSCPFEGGLGEGGPGGGLYPPLPPSIIEEINVIKITKIILIVIKIVICDNIMLFKNIILVVVFEL